MCGTSSLSEKNSIVVYIGDIIIYNAIRRKFILMRKEERVWMKE